MKKGLLTLLFLFAVIRGYGQCTLSVNVTSSSPAICSGTSVVLTATATAGTPAYRYVWSTGETTSSISVNKAGTYTVTVSDNTAGCQPVMQNITITDGVVPNAPTVKDVAVCPNSPATLTATAPGGTYQWYDAATGGNFLASGDTYVTPPITTAATYYVQTTLNGCTSARAAVSVTVTGIPPTANALVCSGNAATLRAAGGAAYAWYDSPSGGTVLGTSSSFTTPPLTVTTVYYVVVTAPNGCVSAPVPVTAGVTPPPQAPAVGGVTVCSGNAATLHATAPAGIIDWFDVPTGGTSLISSPDFTTPGLSVTTTYYVQATVNTCESARTPVTITVNPIPSAPIVPAVTVCSGSSATLTPAGPGGTYNWYNAATGGTLLATGASFTTPALTNSTIYYVDVANGGCASSRSAVNVTVTQPPGQPSASGAVICPGASVTLTAISPGGVYQWYDAASGGNLLATNTSFTTPALNASTTYYVQTTVAGCSSARTPVTVTILPIPTAPVAPGVTVCSGNAATLSVANPTGVYNWYDAAAGGNLLISNSSIFVTPPLVANTTFYVDMVSTSGCESVRTAVEATVTPVPPPPVLTPVTTCPGSSATLTATATGSVSWYSAPVGGSLLATGNTFVTPALSFATTYYAEQTAGSCVSSRAAVIVSIFSLVSPQFQYSSGTFCKTAPNPAPVINNLSGGTFSASPAGLVFISTTTGQINLSASAAGKYSISFAGNGVCPTTTNAVITITTTPDAQFSYAGPYCQDITVASPTFPVGSSAGVFSASPAGLNFANTTTGQINPSKSTPGTYTVTNAIAASGTCAASAFTSTVVIEKSVVVSAGPNQVVPTGTAVTMAGTITGGATAGTWSGGTGTFSNPSLLNAVYTPGPGETSAILTLLSVDPAGSCGPKSSKVTITFTAVPAAPTAAGATVCPGSSATLYATAPGGIYAWYDAPAGGNLLSSGAMFVTPVITANITYYVQTTVSGSTSIRTAVQVIANAIPSPPVATGATICSGSMATLTATGSTGTYAWYDAPVGGNLLSANSTYTTTFLSSSTSYYVEAAGLCTSTRTKVDVIVNPIPHITSSSTATVCSGTALNYSITSDVAGATFSWSRAAVAGISNLPLSNQTTSTITETLINAGNTPVTVTYVITPLDNGCTGSPFNYVVIVNPTPLVTSPATMMACDQSPINYNITFNLPGTGFNWSRAAVPGISNAPISGQAVSTIRESLFNTTNAPIDVIYVITYKAAGCSGLTFNLVVTANPSVAVKSPAASTACSGVPVGYVITSNTAATTYIWSRAAVAGISNPAVSGQTSSTIDESLINTKATPVGVAYLITPFANGCSGKPFRCVVTVNPAVPTPVANANSPICAGSTINLQSPIVPKATYNWSGPNGFTSAQQNPVIKNADASYSGTYNLYITINGCSSTVASVEVMVNPPPLAVAGPDQTVCKNSTSVQLAGSVTGGTITGIWTTSGSGTFSPAPNVLNALYIPSAADIASGLVTLSLSSTSKDNCNISASKMNVAFKSPSITSAPKGTVCNATGQNYVIASDFQAATFLWSRAAVAGISNPAVSGQTTATITEALINPGSTAVDVIYLITPTDNGCPGTTFSYTVTVYPTPAAPVVMASSPVCVNGTINLQTTAIPGATYSWTGPNGFASALQNPTIPNASTAATGTYNLTVTVNTCTSPAGSVNVVVDPLPVSDAGPDQIVCPITTAVQLDGKETGGTPTGKWSTSGTGNFSPSGTVLNAQYLPSAQDVSAGIVTLTLASTSADNCAISTSTMTIKFQLLHAVTAGASQSICSQGGAVLNGQISIPGGGVWTTTGTGTFNPSASQLNATYIPGADDIKAGSVVLTLTANSPGQCYIPSDNLTIRLVPPPTVDAGNTVFVLKGNTATLQPTVSDPAVTYLWAPNINISSTTEKNPVITADGSRTYTLTVTDVRGCVSSDEVNVIVSPEITIPNAFTPNGDGVNDQWNIRGLVAYQQATVDVFDRNGQKIFHSVGYGNPWDGTYKGQQVPYGVYYYIIDPKLTGLQVLSGSVTVIR